jgi:hypothetical protein
MNQALQDQLGALRDEVQAAAIPTGCKHTAAWCLGKLPALYAKFRQTSESRYGDEITRLVRETLTELVNTKPACPEAQHLAASMTERLRLLHEQLGLPGLGLKAAGASSPRSRKAGSSDAKK